MFNDVDSRRKGLRAVNKAMSSRVTLLVTAVLTMLAVLFGLQGLFSKVVAIILTLIIIFAGVTLAAYFDRSAKRGR